jgi:PBP1b-binding outer membrane lipoprotein LpoB
MKQWKIVSIIVLLAFVVIISGCISNPLDPKQQAKDSAKRSFDECNQRCGEGILSSVCKEKCTYDYNQRLDAIENGQY